MNRLITGFVSFVFSLSLLAHPLENIPPGEAETIKALVAGAAAGVKDRRDAHPKANGCVDGVKFVVRADLEAEYRLGIFAKPGESYPAVIRSSNGGDNPDQKGGAQGFALKVILEEQPELQKRLHVIQDEKIFSSVEKKYYLTQDFVLINRARAFFVNNNADYALFFSAQGKAGAAAAEALKAGATQAEADKLRQATFAKIFLLNAEGKLIRPREAAILKMLGEIQTRNPLVEEYHSFVPSAFGDTRAVKYRIVPARASDPDQYEIPEGIDSKADPVFLSKVLMHQLRSGETHYKLYAQFHQEGFPSIEDAASTWPLPKEGLNVHDGYVELGDIIIPQKEAGRELLSSDFCENLTFTPWHTLPEHLPIGGIQRARESIYAAVANARHLSRKQKEVSR